MSIYTKTGDAGTTALTSGERVAKSHARVEAYGDIDELCSYLGLLAALPASAAHAKSLTALQALLMQCGAVVSGSKNADYFITPQSIAWLEHEIDNLQSALPKLQHFVLPGGNVVAGHYHIARCVCRRAERRCVAAAEPSEEYSNVLRLLNRSSDYLFAMARTLCLEQGGKEEIWDVKTVKNTFDAIF